MPREQNEYISSIKFFCSLFIFHILLIDFEQTQYR